MHPKSVTSLQGSPMDDHEIVPFSVADVGVDVDGRTSFENRQLAEYLELATATERRKPKPPPSNLNCEGCNTVEGCGPVNMTCKPINTAEKCGRKIAAAVG
jgi:hypothetical protein